MALRPRQVRLYTEVCTIYRKNKLPNSAGQQTYSVISTGNACKLFTTPNIDSARDAGGIAQIKVDNIFTDNKLHLDAITDIRAEDFVYMTASLNVGQRRWFRVAGDPMTRQGVANYSECYLMPARGLDPTVII